MEIKKPNAIAICGQICIYNIVLKEKGKKKNKIERWRKRILKMKKKLKDLKCKPRDLNAGVMSPARNVVVANPSYLHPYN